MRSPGFRFGIAMVALLAFDLLASAEIRGSGVASRERWYFALVIMTFVFMLSLWLWFENGKLRSRLSAQLAEMSKIQKANQQKSLFLAYTSHELRAPLSAIMGFTQLLQDEKLPAEERKHYLGIMHSTGENVLAIINDILDLAKVEAGHLKVYKANLSLRLLLQELNDVRPAKDSVSFAVEVDPEVEDVICSDVQRLRQILLNLVTNAFKFTERGAVRVSVKATEGSVVFRVRDTGIGIRKEDQKRLFQTYTQLEAQGPNLIQGTGIGLTLSRNLARLLGGDLRLEKSVLGEGSCFALSLPRVLSVGPALALPAAGLSAEVFASSEEPRHVLSHAKKILLVDDSDISRLLLSRILHKQGIAVQTATNGEEGVRKALNESYDAVLMDVQMPVMDGHEATRRLRRLGYDRPIIALTAQAMVEDRQRCLQAGCNDYLSKPVQFDHLFETLARTIQEMDPSHPTSHPTFICE